MKVLLLLALIVVSKAAILEDARVLADSKEYVWGKYDCKHFTETLRVHIMNTYHIYAHKTIRAVNCDSGYWAKPCGLHMFLKVPYNGSHFYIESTTGFEITEDLYPIYTVSYPL